MKKVTIELGMFAAKELQKKAAAQGVTLATLCEAVAEGYAAQGQDHLDDYVSGYCSAASSSQEN